MVVNPKVAGDMTTTFSELQSLDTHIRNTEWLLNEQAEELSKEASPDKIKDLIADLENARVAEKAAEAAQVSAQKIYERRRDKYLSLEANVFRKSVEIEKLTEDVTSLHYDYLEQRFPSLTDAARYLFHTAVSEHVCLICGTEGEQPLARIVEKTKSHHCPLCDSSIPSHGKVVPLVAKTVHSQTAELESERQLHSHWLQDLKILSEKLSEATSALRKANMDFMRTRRQVQELEAQLPDSDRSASDLRAENERTRIAIEADKKDRTKKAERYRNLIKEAKRDLEAIEKRLHQRFVYYAQAFLHEKVDLVLDSRKVLLVTGSGRINIPSFRVQMASPANPGLVERDNMDSVSESQKEFLDLAFRMAIIDVVAPRQQDAMLVIETPEASLDAIFIRRAAHMLRAFSNAGATLSKRTVLATSNLTGAKMISALLGLTGPKAKLSKKDRNRVINLLDYAAPPTSYKDEQRAFKRVLQEALHERRQISRA
jgi:hypothetical protein